MEPRMSKRELYGGTIVVQLPSDYLDASDLRQIPDHQEVFLSPDTLTSIIFEINQYQTSTVITSANSATITSSTSSQDAAVNADEAAASYHFADPIGPPDHLSSTGIITQHISLGSPSLSKYPSYISVGTILTPELDKSAPSALPQDWQTSPAIKKTETKVYQLLVRMQDQDTDFCVRINVPLKEYGGDQSRIQQEEILAGEIMKNIVESLEVKDFELFGGE